MFISALYFLFLFEVCPIDVGMDQVVDLQKVSVVIEPTSSSDFTPTDLIKTIGSGVIIPNQPDSPKPTIQVQLTEGTPVNVVLITLYGK